MNRMNPNAQPSCAAGPREAWDLTVGPRARWFDLNLQDLWRYRDLVVLFVRRDFVANVSHELRTPLTAIRGYAETLSGDLSDEQRAQFLEVILRHADRLGTLISDLLDLSRIEGGTRDFSREPIDVAAMVRGLLQDLKPRLDARELRAEVRATQAPRALADRRALEQVLLNLLDNAIKYTSPGGEHTVAIRRTQVAARAGDGLLDRLRKQDRPALDQCRNDHRREQQTRSQPQAGKPGIRGAHRSTRAAPRACLAAPPYAGQAIRQGWCTRHLLSITAAPPIRQNK